MPKQNLFHGPEHDPQKDQDEDHVPSTGQFHTPVWTDEIPEHRQGAKHLVQESFPSWPGYYTSTFGQNVRAEFDKFIQNPNLADIDCHVIFSIVEYLVVVSVIVAALQKRGTA